MARSSLPLKQSFKLLKSALLERDLREHVLLVAPQLTYLLVQRDFLVFKARDLPLQLCLVRFLVVRDALKRGQFLVNLITLSRHLVVVLSRVLELSRDVVDVPLKRQDLLNVILFLLLVLSDCKAGATNFLLSGLDLRE
mmetsp:Transcript_19159/g.23704  ORF Transcript_19159/g.23704 Transcript_19159/m.23704 type:complete len:139 (-) Transcript_19159:3034-3450(-)